MDVFRCDPGHGGAAAYLGAPHHGKRPMTDSLLLPHEIGRISYSIRSCSRCSGELQPNGGTGRRAWRCAVCDRTARDR